MLLHAEMRVSALLLFHVHVGKKILRSYIDINSPHLADRNMQL